MDWLYGIDSAAHIGAKKEIGNTIAVLGGGINNIFPEENIPLYKQIIGNNGLVISEQEPKEIAESKNFPKRNRIIAGLSEIIIVVEAKHRSGSTITAKYAFEQNKKVFCVPSNLGVKNGIGTNRLIYEGAKILIDVNDILKEFNLKNNKIITKKNIKKEYFPIYEILTYMPMHINDIAKKLNKPVYEISPILTMMELDGLIKSVTGGEFIKEE